MLYRQKRVRLKNGDIVLLRLPKEEDAKQMVLYQKTTAEETEYLARYPEEKKYDVLSEQRKLKNMIDADDCIMLICEHEGKIIGNCQIIFMTTLKTKHRATMMISVLQEFWSRGIGTLMMNELISIAKENHVQQLELQVIEGNERAIALYKKNGFEIIAQIPNAYRLKDGSYKKELYMIKPIEGLEI